GSPASRLCWQANAWSCSRKPLGSCCALQFCGIHRIQALCRNGKRARSRPGTLASSSIPWRCAAPTNTRARSNEAVKAGSAALAACATPLAASNQERIAGLAAKNRLPAIYVQGSFVETGGLMSYGPDRTERYRRVAVFVDKILKGTKPADLPVEQPTKFEFIINLKAAKQIGLTIPPNVLARADKVIR